MFNKYNNSEEIFSTFSKEENEGIESETKLEIKKMITSLSKKRFEDIIPLKVLNFFFLLSKIILFLKKFNEIF